MTKREGHKDQIEDPKNRIITNYESEVGPGVLQFSIQQSMALQDFQTKGTELKHSQKRTSCTFVILAAVLKALQVQVQCLLKAGPEHSRSDLAFKRPKLRNNLIFRMLC